MDVVIIKYNAGNIYSVVHALNRLGVSPIVTDNKETISRADCVLFPGQGEASKTMEYLRNNQMDILIRQLKQPVLGICIGMQLLCSHSEEGNTPCLGMFDVPVQRFCPKRHEDKIPHMGWNTISHLQSPLFEGSSEDAYVYFVHSYYVPVNPYSIAVTDYVHPFSAAIRKNNFYAVQFHPEKSGKTGEHILRNFLNLAAQQ